VLDLVELPAALVHEEELAVAGDATGPDLDLVGMHQRKALDRRDRKAGDGSHNTGASSLAPLASGASLSSSKTKKSRPVTCTATLYTGTAPTAPANVP
jgi:hypothetical protein